MSHFASCCVLSFERPDFLRTGIESLLASAGAQLELIIHDDGSRDSRCYEVLRDLQGQGATVITNAPGHNQGQGTALNRMFRMAKGDPIIKLDQDLLYRPGWLADVNNLLASNADRSYEPTHGIAKEPRIGLLGLLHYHHDPVASIKCKIAEHGSWQSHTHILGSGFAVPRDCWRKLGPFSEHSAAFAEDWQFQRKVTDSEDWVCGLPNEDLVENRGMGIGPSTVVIGPGQVRPIHTEPYILGHDDG